MEVVSRTITKNRTIPNITVNVSDLYDHCYSLYGDVRAFYIPFLHIFVMILGLVANLYMIVAVYCLKKRARKTVSNVLGDLDFFFSYLGVCNIVTVLTVPAWVTQSVFPQGWIFGLVLCKVLKGFNTFCWQYGIFLLVYINVERYMKVVHNETTFKCLKQKSRSSARRIITRGLSAVPLIASIVDVFYYNVVQLSQNTAMCNNMMHPYSRIVTFWIRMTVCFFIPLFFLMYCNGRIVCTVRKHSKNKLFSSNMRRSQIAPFLTGMFFMCCWIPWIVSTVYYRWHVGCVQSMHVVLNVSVAIGNLHCFTTPTLYIVTRIHKFARKNESFRIRHRTNTSVTQ